MYTKFIRTICEKVYLWWVFREVRLGKRIKIKRKLLRS